MKKVLYIFALSLVILMSSVLVSARDEVLAGDLNLDGWVHYSTIYTVERLDSNNGAEFTIYLNPKNSVGFDFMADNISVVKQ